MNAVRGKGGAKPAAFSGPRPVTTENAKIEDRRLLCAICNPLRFALRSCLIAGAFLLLPSCLWAAQYDIHVKTSPRLELIRPLSEPTAVSILVTSADGRPVREGWVEVALEAPQPSRWFSTDFPLIEGTRLFDMRLNLTRGKAEWRYLFPIRGKYAMRVDFVTPARERVSRVFDINVRERGTKWLFLGSFTLGLFALGFIAGRIFSPIAAGARNGMVGAVAFSIWSVASVGAVAPATPEPSGRLEVGPAVVGRPAPVRWRLKGDLKPPDAGAVLTLTITHLEKGVPVFAIDKLTVGEEFSMNFQFTDGAEYRLGAVVDVPPAPPLRTERIVMVNAIEPPARAMIAPMVLFLSALAGGLAAGRWSRGKGACATALSG
jgi:hypothetical protein